MPLPVSEKAFRRYARRGLRAAFVKADNGFAFANRIFDGKCEPHAFEPAARDVWVRRKRRPHTPRRDSRAEGGRREGRKRFCILIPPYLLLAGCLLPPQSPFNANVPIILLCALEWISPNGIFGALTFLRFCRFL